VPSFHCVAFKCCFLFLYTEEHWIPSLERQSLSMFIYYLTKELPRRILNEYIFVDEIRSLTHPFNPNHQVPFYRFVEMKLRLR